MRAEHRLTRPVTSRRRLFGLSQPFSFHSRSIHPSPPTHHHAMKRAGSPVSEHREHDIDIDNDNEGSEGNLTSPQATGSTGAGNASAPNTTAPEGPPPFKRTKASKACLGCRHVRAPSI